MSDATTPHCSKSIPDLVREIETCAANSDDQTVQTAMRLLELRRRIEQGELGDVNWRTWVGDHVGLSRSRLGMLMQIAEAEDPRAEAVRLREMNAARQRRFKASRASQHDVPEECREVIRWAKRASAREAKPVLRLIHLQGQRSASVDNRHA